MGLVKVPKGQPALAYLLSMIIGVFPNVNKNVQEWTYNRRSDPPRGDLWQDFLGDQQTCMFRVCLVGGNGKERKGKERKRFQNALIPLFGWKKSIPLKWPI